MTIQMQNQESTGPSLKVKLIIFSVVLIAFCIIGVILHFNYAADKYSAKTYESTKSVEEVFVTDQKTFIEVAHLLNNSDLFDYLYSIDRKSIFNTSIPQREKYFTDEEYEFLCQFLNKYRPYEIGKKDGDLYFVFLCEKNDVTLYYTEREDESLSDLLNVLNQHSEVKMLKDKWYFRVQASDVIRK